MSSSPLMIVLAATASCWGLPADSGSLDALRSRARRPLPPPGAATPSAPLPAWARWPRRSASEVGRAFSRQT